MALFCQELQCFLSTVPADARIQDYSVEKGSLWKQQLPMYSNLAEACDPSRTAYMQASINPMLIASTYGL